MKKFLLAATLLAALTTSAIAGGNETKKMLSDLKASLKNVNESAWTTNDFYKKTTFKFNNEIANAYVNAETGDLIGFGIPISNDALPAGTKENLAKHYDGWQVVKSAMFIDASGNLAYYTQVTKGKKTIALRVSQKGKTSFYAQMPNNEAGFAVNY